MRIKKYVLILSGLISFIAINSHAATLEQIDPSRFPKSLESTRKPTVKSSRITLPAPSETPIQGAHQIKFVLHKLTVQGGWAIPNEKLRPYYESKLGKTITVAELQQIVNQITTFYRNQGYILTQAILPPQEIEHGNVVIRIMEGFIDNVSVEGDITPEIKRLLTTYARRVASVRPLHADTLERYALLADDIPGLIVKTMITPSKNKIGAADLIFVVERNKYEAAVSYDNRGTKILGPHRLTLTGNYYGLGTAGNTAFRVIGTIPDWEDIQYYELSHGQGIGISEWRIDLSASHTITRPRTSLGGGPILNLIGNSTRVTAQLSYPIIRTRQQNLSLIGGFRLLNTDTKTFVGKLFDDKLRVLNIGGTYDLADPYGVNLLALMLHQGLNTIGAKSSPQTRTGGRLDFTRIESHITRIHSLPQNFSLLLAAGGQIAFNELLSAEEFGIGGTQFGSAYDPSEITGDHGIAGKAELRYDIKKQFSDYIQGPQLYVFYDGGIVWNINRPQQPSRDSLTSIGGGMRVNAFKDHLSVSLEIAKPITRKVANHNNKDARVFVTITGRT